jgi:hypothetical protein
MVGQALPHGLVGRVYFSLTRKFQQEFFYFDRAKYIPSGWLNMSLIADGDAPKSLARVNVLSAPSLQEIFLDAPDRCR